MRIGATLKDTGLEKWHLNISEITDSTFTQSENDPTSLTSGKRTENSPSHNLRTILRHRAVGNVQQTSGSTERHHKISVIRKVITKLFMHINIS
jgi:hypothetical protein